MRITIEKHGTCVSVNSEHNINKKDVLQICDKAYDIIHDVFSKTATQDCDKNAAEENVRQVPVQQPIPDTPLIRPRIPNNVVDVKDLSIEKAVTENALVRCPNCGQAHCLAVPSNNRIYLMRRDFEKNEFGIVAEFDSVNSQDFIGVCCKPETDRQAYYNDLQSLSFEGDTDFAVDNDTEIFCPVCCQSRNFKEWKDAFDNPLEFFETDQLCDACGGEKLEKFIKKHKVYQCDKCGLQVDIKERGE